MAFFCPTLGRRDRAQPRSLAIENLLDHSGLPRCEENLVGNLFELFKEVEHCRLRLEYPGRSVRDLQVAKDPFPVSPSRNDVQIVRAIDRKSTRLNSSHL